MTWARNLSAATAGQPTWPVGAGHAAKPHDRGAKGAAMPGMSAAEMAAMTGRASAPGIVEDLAVLDRLVPIAARLHPLRPIWIVPPASGAGAWTIESQAQNRPQRVTYRVAPDGRLIGVSDFAGQPVVDKVVAVTTASHEGQLFGRLNQALLLTTAMGLIVVAISGAVMWWRRRPAGVLGAPPIGAARESTPLLAMAILTLAVLLPLFGLSLASVLSLDVAVLSRAATPTAT